MSRTETDWSLYGPCPRCNTVAGQPCGTLAWWTYDPNTTRPHRGRRKVKRSATTTQHTG